MVCSCGAQATITSDSPSEIRDLVVVFCDNHEHPKSLTAEELLPYGLQTAQSTVKASPPKYAPVEGPPWPLAQALYYAHQPEVARYSWDEMTNGAQNAWARTAAVAIKIVADGEDPYDYIKGYEEKAATT